jgi:hypothetical protein
MRARREGRVINDKRVDRLYAEARVQVRLRYLPARTFKRLDVPMREWLSSPMTTSWNGRTSAPQRPAIFEYRRICRCADAFKTPFLPPRRRDGPDSPGSKRSGYF